MEAESLVVRANTEMNPLTLLSDREVLALDDSVRNLIAPFLDEEVGGRVYLPDRSVIFVVNQPGDGLIREGIYGYPDDLRLVVADADYRDKALLAINLENNEIVVAEVFDEAGFRSTWSSMRGLFRLNSTPEEVITVFNRQATNNEIGQLHQACVTTLGESQETELMMIGGGIDLRASLEPVTYIARVTGNKENEIGISLSIDAQFAGSDEVSHKWVKDFRLKNGECNWYPPMSNYSFDHPPGETDPLAVPISHSDFLLLLRIFNRPLLKDNELIF
ncbi:hypothetical protein ACFLZ1_03390 [Patescibacteria group bacterium]